MADKKVYFYRRDAEYGYDQISFCAFTKTQADALLKETVTKPEEWNYHHSKNLDWVYDDCYEGSINAEL